MRKGINAVGFIGALICIVVMIFNLLSGNQVEEVKLPGGAGLKFRSTQTPTVNKTTQSSPELKNPKPVAPKSSSPQASAESEVSKTGVAIVFDPPSNVRDSPNGKILCSVRARTTINIYDSTNSWYRTDVCGEMGVIHDSQITFSLN